MEKLYQVPASESFCQIRCHLRKKRAFGEGKSAGEGGGWLCLPDPPALQTFSKQHPGSPKPYPETGNTFIIDGSVPGECKLLKQTRHN